MGSKGGSSNLLPFGKIQLPVSQVRLLQLLIEDSRLVQSGQVNSIEEIRAVLDVRGVPIALEDRYVFPPITFSDNGQGLLGFRKLDLFLACGGGSSGLHQPEGLKGG